MAMSSDTLFWLGGGVLALAGMALLAWALFWDRARGRKRCPNCWYDMSQAAPQSPLRCTECGYEAKNERKLFRTRWRWRWAFVCLIPLLAAAFLFVQPKV